VSRLFRQLIGDNEGEQHSAARQVKPLGEEERGELLRLLTAQVERHPDQMAGPNALQLLASEKVGGAAQTLFAALKNASAESLHPGIVFRIQSLALAEPTLADEARQTLQHLSSKKGTRIGTAADKALKG
jgi:hypothetical protein